MFKEPFESDKISWFVARKQLREEIVPDWSKGDPEPSNEAIEVRKQIVLKGWNNKLVNSQDYGIDIHDIAEKINNNKEVSPEYELFKRQLNAIYSHYRFLYSEFKVYSEKYRVAGTIDTIGIRQKTLNSFVDFSDFKTNIEKGITFTSSKLNDKGQLKHYRKMYLKPIDHLEECTYNEYALKLSLYAYLFEQEYKMKPGRLFILFIKDMKPEENLVQKIFKLQEYPVPYMKNEVIAMLEHYRKNNNFALNVDLDDY